MVLTTNGRKPALQTGPVKKTVILSQNVKPKEFPKLTAEQRYPKAAAKVLPFKTGLPPIQAADLRDMAMNRKRLAVAEEKRRAVQAKRALLAKKAEPQPAAPKKGRGRKAVL